VEAAPLEAAERVAVGAFEPATPRPRIDIRALSPVAAVTAVPLLGLVICLAATHTIALDPVDRLLPASMAGELRAAGFKVPIAVAIGFIMLLFAAYVTAARLAERVTPRTMWTAVIAFNVIVLLGPPLFSSDVFSYQAYARLFADYHANPYTHGPSSMQYDPLYNFIGAKWINTPSVYGPLFTLASGALAGASITFSEFTFKLVAALASVGTLVLVWRSAGLRKVNQTRAIALFGLNPLVTLYGVGGGHNDLLMLLFTTAAIYFLLMRRDIAGGASVIIGAAIKLTGGLLLPFVLADRSNRDGLRRRGKRFLIGAAAATVVLAIPSFIVFGNGLLKMPATLQRVQGEGQWQSIPGFFINLAGIDETHLITTAFGLIFAVACLWLLRRVWQGRMDWIEGAAWATFALLATAGTLLPWYVSWLLPLVALTSNSRLWKVALWITGIATVMTVITYLPSGIPFLNI
jgi:hypothetical protein